LTKEATRSNPPGSIWVRRTCFLPAALPQAPFKECQEVPGGFPQGIFPSEKNDRKTSRKYTQMGFFSAFSEDYHMTSFILLASTKNKMDCTIPKN
jgi:hypothetical protein